MAVQPDDVVLITGGTGSFGGAALQKMLRTGCRQVRIFSRDENKQHMMRVALADARIEFHIGDVRDVDSLDRVMHGVDVVFHAAALKQVPSCEFFPIEAVRTNVIGSANVIDSAQRHGVRSVVCLSTDKAVLPVSAMGMTKALMEKVVATQARTPSGSVVCSVRYGNVLFSRGSVLPLFLDQALARRPITVTDPEMTRFLLSLSSAIDLIDSALTLAQPGDTFLRRSPAARIGDLAEAVRRLLDADVPIEVIGIRHGEKRFETLATGRELLKAESFDDFLRIPTDGRGLDYGLYHTSGTPELANHDDYHSDNAERLTADELVVMLRPAVEQYVADR